MPGDRISAVTELSPYVNCGSLHELTRPEDWPADRPVWIQSGGGSIERIVWADHLERGGDGGEALVLRAFMWDEEPAAGTVTVLEWAAPPGTASIPQTTAHRSEAGVRARIAAVAADLGAEPVEDEKPAPQRMVMVRSSLVLQP